MNFGSIGFHRIDSFENLDDKIEIKTRKKIILIYLFFCFFLLAYTHAVHALLIIRSLLKLTYEIDFHTF
jgi:hypothetical protein